MRRPNDVHICPLMEKEISWSECVEVQEVREDNMDMGFLSQPIDLEKANTACEKKCRWCYVSHD